MLTKLNCCRHSSASNLNKVDDINTEGMSASIPGVKTVVHFVVLLKVHVAYPI